MIKRRSFLKLAGSTAAMVFAMSRSVRTADGSVQGGSPGDIPRRLLGGTGVQVSIVGLGATCHEKRAVRFQERISSTAVLPALEGGPVGPTLQNRE